MSRPFAPALLAAALILALVIPACRGNTQQLPYNGTYGFRVVLKNNPAAVDPTWDQLVAFLKADRTDEMEYIDEDFMCGAFAQDVHNNAEKAGIRAAWVGVDLAGRSIGHAVNVFNTTDRGLVFTDSTGQTAEEHLMELHKLEAEADGVVSVTEGDRVAYVEKGKELGFISLSVNPSPDYAYFESYRVKSGEFEAKLAGFNKKVEAYNSEVEEYNRWVSGTTFIAGSSEARRAGEWKGQLQMSLYLLKSQEAGLDKEKAGLGPIWEPMGIVSNISVRW
ncbi:MAG: hypothetical protein PHU23_14190 [Dehalococcoidales bacterium]|nr:hypothetical protein [Dehalococcoidales bacterium]